MADPVFIVQDILVTLSDGRVLEARPVRIVDETITPNAAGQTIDVWPVMVVSGGGGSIRSDVDFISEAAAPASVVATLSVPGWDDVTFSIADGEDADGVLSITGDNVILDEAVVAGVDGPLVIRVKAVNNDADDYTATVGTLSYDVLQALATLGVSSLNYLTGAAAGSVMANITNKTPGSTITISFTNPADAGKLVISGDSTQVLRGLAAAADGAIQYTLLETLAGAVNSPHPTTINAVFETVSAPVLVNITEKWGRYTYPDVGGGQTDLAATLGRVDYGGLIPPGVQEWQVQNATASTGATGDFIFNSGASNPLTAAGYVAGNTGKTPYTTKHPASSTQTQGTYTWEYRVRVDGGPWSNWATYTRVVQNDGCSIGDTAGNFAGAIYYHYGDGSQAYNAGIRVHLIPPGLSRPDIRMGTGFNFSAGTGWSTSAMMKVMWANNQRCPTLSAISWGSDGLWIDLEYDGVTVLGGRLIGANANVAAKIQISGNNNRITRVNGRNSEADFTIEHQSPGPSTWGFIVVNGNNNEIGYQPGGPLDYSYANYGTHCFYGIYCPTGNGNKVRGNVIAHMHGRSIGRGLNDDNDVKYNLVGQTWRTRYPTSDTGNHLDHIWANDGVGGDVEQNPTIENNLIYPYGGFSSSARQIVLGSTGPTLEIATPTVRGNIVIGPYTYGSELGRWTGAARQTHNTFILSLVGDFSADIALGYPPDQGNQAMRMGSIPLTLSGGATMTSDKNFLWNNRDYSAAVLAVLTGTDVQNARSASPTGFPGGSNPQTVFAAAPLSTWDDPTNAAMCNALLSYVFGVLARASDGSVNSAGTNWATLP